MPVVGRPVLLTTGAYAADSSEWFRLVGVSVSAFGARYANEIAAVALSWRMRAHWGATMASPPPLPTLLQAVQPGPSPESQTRE